MDLQNKLRILTRFLLKPLAKDIQVFIHDPEAGSKEICVVVICKCLNIDFKGSSFSDDIFTAYFKAVCELGENLISNDVGLTNRNGLAGGLIWKNTLLRARAELLERDSFIFHYRNRLAGKILTDNKEYILLKLSSSDPRFHVVMTVGKDYLNFAHTCLCVGLAASMDLEEATRKSLNEYNGMRLNHRLITCREKPLGEPDNWLKLTDFHHNESRNPLNKKIFRELCSGKEMMYSRVFSADLWRVQKIKSPVRLLKYALVNHPQLESLSFGIPYEVIGFENRVFHPFW